jgi:surfeit locus 1 family protein
MRRLLFLLTFGLTGFAILIALGSWQLRRMAWKDELIARINREISAAPVALPAAPDPVGDKYLPVAVTGSILAGELHVLVSLDKVGTGYRVIAPFEISDGRRILLDRGFVATTGKDRPRVTGPAEITGNLHWPQETDGFTPEPDLGANIWFARNVPKMAQALDTEPVLLVARSQNDPGLRPLPVGTSRISNDHLNYAITWFSLALIWALMTGYFLWSSRAKSRKQNR